MTPATAPPAAAPGIQRRSGSAGRARLFVGRFLSRSDGRYGLLILAFFAVLALFPDLLVGKLETATTATGQSLQPPGGGYLFGELRPTTSDVRLPSTAQLSSALSANGLSGTPSLSWTWTTNDTPPFAPFLTGTDAAGKTAFVTASGVSEQLPFVNGITPLAN